MTKYFAQDTPQASLERMMMSVPGFQRRGGGISFSSFHYKPEDVDCQYCLHYRRKSCQIPICPYIAERLASGALEYHDLILECLGRNLRLRLYQRIRSVTHWDGPDQAILYKIRPYCQKAANRPQEDIPSVYWAALYLWPQGNRFGRRQFRHLPADILTFTAFPAGAWRFGTIPSFIPPNGCMSENSPWTPVNWQAGA